MFTKIRLIFFDPNTYYLIHRIKEAVKRGWVLWRGWGGVVKNVWGRRFKRTC